MKCRKLVFEKYQKVSRFFFVAYKITTRTYSYIDILKHRSPQIDVMDMWHRFCE